MSQNLRLYGDSRINYTKEVLWNRSPGLLNNIFLGFSPNLGVTFWRHDTQYNNTQHNIIQNNENSSENTLSIWTLSITTLSISITATTITRIYYNRQSNTLYIVMFCVMRLNVIIVKVVAPKVWFDLLRFGKNYFKKRFIWLSLSIYFHVHFEQICLFYLISTSTRT